MRIRKSSADSAFLSSCSSASASSSSSCSSSSSPPSSYNSSSITENSLASSTDSSLSEVPSTSCSPIIRCQGLNLLVKAIHQVTAGSTVGVPYIQRRVIRRRRRRVLISGRFCGSAMDPEKPASSVAAEI